MAIASLIILDSSIWSLWVQFTYQALHLFMRETILFLFLRSWWAHQLNEGSCLMPSATTHSSIWTTYKSLRLNNFYEEVEPYFHLSQMSYSGVNFLVVYSPLTITLWSFNTQYLISFSVVDKLHLAYIDSAIIFAVNSVTTAENLTF